RLSQTLHSVRYRWLIPPPKGFLYERPAQTKVRQGESRRVGATACNEQSRPVSTRISGAQALSCITPVVLLFRQQAGDVVATPAVLALHRWTLECLTTIPDSPDTDCESRVCRTPFPDAMETDGTT